MDIEIFDSLFDKHWEQVYSSAFARLTNRKKSREITQEAFFQLWQKKDRVLVANALLFLLNAVQSEILRLMRNECLQTVQPAVALFRYMDLPFAN